MTSRTYQFGNSVKVNKVTMQQSGTMIEVVVWGPQPLELERDVHQLKQTLKPMALVRNRKKKKKRNRAVSIIKYLHEHAAFVAWESWKPTEKGKGKSRRKPKIETNSGNLLFWGHRRGLPVPATAALVISNIDRLLPLQSLILFRVCKLLNWRTTLAFGGGHIRFTGAAGPPLSRPLPGPPIGARKAGRHHLKKQTALPPPPSTTERTVTRQRTPGWGLISSSVRSLSSPVESLR